MKQLGGDRQYAYWMIDPEWINASADRFESHKFMIDLDAKTPPDIESLEEKYGKIARVYVKDLPTPIKQRPADSRYSRSLSPSVPRSDRSASPFVTIYSPSLPANALPPMPGYPYAQPGAPQQQIRIGKLCLNVLIR